VEARTPPRYAASSPHAVTNFRAYLVIAGFGAVVAYTVSLYAKVALATVLAVGPVLIALALFNSTKRFTESWLGQVVNYVVLQQQFSFSIFEDALWGLARFSRNEGLSFRAGAGAA